MKKCKYLGVLEAVKLIRIVGYLMQLCTKTDQNLKTCNCPFYQRGSLLVDNSYSGTTEDE